MPKISDHAVCRYLEREAGVDIEAHRRQLEEKVSSASLQRVIGFAGNAGFKVRIDGVTYCFRNGVMTTCYPE